MVCLPPTNFFNQTPRFYPPPPHTLACWLLTTSRVPCNPSLPPVAPLFTPPPSLRKEFSPPSTPTQVFPLFSPPALRTPFDVFSPFRFPVAYISYFWFKRGLRFLFFLIFSVSLLSCRASGRVGHLRPARRLLSFDWSVPSLFTRSQPGSIPPPSSFFGFDYFRTSRPVAFPPFFYRFSFSTFKECFFASPFGVVVILLLFFPHCLL